MKKTFGGHRLGAGNKMEVELKNYERSTHNLGFIYRTSQAPGTLVPFLVQVALPGDTWDIKLNSDVKTHPTLGPLFGSFKHQMDIFVAPIRLYHSALMQNMVALGNAMSTVLLPQMSNNNIAVNTAIQATSPDNIQVNPSSLLAYLGVRGWGWNTQAGVATRTLNAIPLIAYWEIYKLFYANKQELNGSYIQMPAAVNTVSAVSANGTAISQYPTMTNTVPMNTGFTITGTGAAPDLNQIFINTTNLGQVPALQIGTWTLNGLVWTLQSIATAQQPIVNAWGYIPVQQLAVPTTFPLSNIDNLKQIIFQTAATAQLTINSGTTDPFGKILTAANMLGSQNGLALKTYQSDLFNNWLNISWYSTIQSNTAVSTAGNQFSIDSLILAKKLYEFLNDVAVSGGTYIDWIHAAYAHNPYSQCYSPMYYGGLSKEVVFQEVISLAAQTNQPLGTLAGRGIMHSKHKGGTIHIKVDEPSFIIGIQSLTPRVDYSQGNFWYTYALQNMDNLHKPPLDSIGFQTLITEQLTWWATHTITTTTWGQTGAGYQPAWTNYMTNVNQTFGNFAVQNNEMFMTLNRRYTMNTSNFNIADLTTYIDPSHYNFIFAETDIAAQNFWVQISIDAIVRRKMSAKVMPRL